MAHIARNIITVFLFLSGILSQTTACAQEIIIIQTTENDKKILKENKPNEPNTPEVPLFELTDRSGSFVMALGGYIKPIMGWDIGNDLNDISVVPNEIPIPAEKGHKSHFYLNPTHSAFDLQMIGLKGTKNQITGYIAAKYTGSGRTLKLSKMYILYRGFRFGLATSIYTDGDAMPNTLDPQGPNGAISTSTYQISYNHKARNGLSLAVGMEKPTFDSYSGVYKGKDYPEFYDKDIYANASQSCPDFTAYLQYQPKSGIARVRLSGIVRNFRYVDEIKDKVEGVFGWGAMLSGNLRPCAPLTIYYECSYGKGIAAYYQDLCGLPLSYIPMENPYRMQASPMMGWQTGATANVSKKIQVGAVVSQNRVWDVETYYDKYRYGLYAEGCVLYRITPYLQWGIEYIYGQLNNYIGGQGSVNRIQTAVILSL
jgi:hypothetical protein